MKNGQNDLQKGDRMKDTSNLYEFPNIMCHNVISIAKRYIIANDSEVLVSVWPHPIDFMIFLRNKFDKQMLLSTWTIDQLKRAVFAFGIELISNKSICKYKLLVARLLLFF